MQEEISVCKQWGGKRKYALLLHLLFTRPNKRAEVLKKSELFYCFGERCYWHSAKIPPEPFLVAIHNNVKIATNVTFFTHDIVQGVFNEDIELNPDKKKSMYGGYHWGTIEVFDNVFIGGNSTICPDVKIGPNAIVAAGSVVVKDVLPGTIVGGNPAKVIGSYSELAKRRYEIHHMKYLPFENATYKEVVDYYWKRNELSDK